MIYEQLYTEAAKAGREEGLLDAAAAVARQADEIAEQRVTEKLSTALPALRAAAMSLQSERDSWIIRWEHTAVRLGVAIAEKLIQHQLVARPDFATEMITDRAPIGCGAGEDYGISASGRPCSVG